MKAWISADHSGWGSWTWVAHLDDRKEIRESDASRLAESLRRAHVDEIAFVSPEEGTQVLGKRLQAAMELAWEHSSPRR